MAPPPTTAPAPDETQDDAQWRTAGERIQALLDASAAGGAVARERAQRLAGEITDLYGAAIARMLRLARAVDPNLAEVFASDDLVASLLLVHGLHPHDTARRVSTALDAVRPYLGSHGGDVSLLGVADGVVRLQLRGNCTSCPSSAVTLDFAVRDAVLAAAPEIEDIEVVATEPDPATAMIPADSLLRRVHAGVSQVGVWRAVPELADLRDAEVGGFRVAGTAAVACRIGSTVYAYRDLCAACTGPLTGARLAGTVLHCPGCGAGFDVVRAGAGVDVAAAANHLEPLPLLERDGVLSIAVPDSAAVA